MPTPAPKRTLPDFRSILSKDTATNRVYVWDLPLRVFHWALFATVAAALVSSQIGGNAMDWHGRFGIAVLGLLVFRLVWGVIGSTYARFRTFVPGPAKLAAYVRGEWSGLGHNPLGALSVVGMLLALAIQTVSGLFANDDIAFQGPYAVMVSDHTAALFTRLHKSNAWVLALLVCIHLTAIAFYARFKRKNLVTPMIVGHQPAAGEHCVSAKGGGLVAFLAALAFAVAAAWLASGADLAEKPSSPQAAETPSW